MAKIVLPDQGADPQAGGRAGGDRQGRPDRELRTEMIRHQEDVIAQCLRPLRLVLPGIGTPCPGDLAPQIGTLVLQSPCGRPPGFLMPDDASLSDGDRIPQESVIPPLPYGMTIRLRQTAEEDTSGVTMLRLAHHC